ncbi:MAG: ABC transporter permease [Nitrospirota bacterium]|nr:ABC transporter permease [Nitrospirota bacterium]
MKPVILFTDIIVFAVTGFAVYFLVASRRGGEAARAWGEIKKSKVALISLLILSAYLGVALVDSIRYRDAMTDEGGAERVIDGAIVYEPQALSILDRALGGLSARAEKSYSAPLADRLFTKETVTDDLGRTRRDYPALNYPGAHLLGTDKVGSDILLAALKGIRTAIVIGAGATVVIIPFAIFFGVVAGYFGGVIDDAVQYVYTTLSSIPGVLLIVAFMLLFGGTGYQGGIVTQENIALKYFVFNDRLFWLCLILGITSWTDLCRLVRAETLKLRELEYAQAAKALGGSSAGIILRHIIPNLLHIVLITMALQFSGLVLAEAVLSYIGIGVGPQYGSWGNMINTARLELTREPVVWWNLTAAFVFMLFLVLPANIFADAVRDALDPKTKKR